MILQWQQLLSTIAGLPPKYSAAFWWLCNIFAAQN
jgi:hypothetical protein